MPNFLLQQRRALITGTLYVTIPMTEKLTLSLREEYAFGRQELEVSRYSYNVINSKGNNLLRADNLPYHRTDYRRRALTHPPHHTHDERGRVRSFTGQVQKFISYAKSSLTPTATE